MYNGGEFSKEILIGLKRLLNEKKVAYDEMKKEEELLREEIGYQMALYNLNEKVYRNGANPYMRESVDKAKLALIKFNEAEKNIQNKMHLPEEIDKLKEMIEELEK